jgi:transcription antitermination factor NusG
MGRMCQLDMSQGLAPSYESSPSELRWYALYTCAQHEKSVAKQLAVRSVECFLPLYEKMRRWKDRRVKIQFPLFAGYVFARLSLKDRLRAVQVPGSVRLVGFNGQPTPLPDDEILALRNGLSAAPGAEPCPYVQVGRRVRILSGPLTGLEGILQKKKSGMRFVISLHLIQRSVTVEVRATDLEPVQELGRR